MADNSSNNRRIAKNTILLYIRMFITMIVGLFTSRVLLDSLGVEDYGIYNLVGGFVSMFAVVRAGLVSSTQRFITFDIGRGNLKNLNRTFSTITLIYIILCIVVLILAEIIGVWFIENKLMIPLYRMTAARWVFQFSLLALIVTLLSSSYNSLIIAHERMNAFAYITIYEVIAKLVVAYIIYIATSDKLIVYAILICFVHITVPILYWLYCQRNFNEEVKIQWHLDFKKIEEIYAFAGWSMLGGIANMGFTQGLNMLLGMFFTPVVNAARGVAVQVQSIVQQFVLNFQMAVDPQIIKSYARGEKDYMYSLVSKSSRLSYYLLFFISLPIFFEADILLSWWLKEVPEYTSLFLRLILITTMYDAISNPYGKAIHATGNIRTYQIICSSILILIIPVAYVTLRLGAPAYSVFVVHIVLGLIAMLIRISIANRIFDKSLKSVLETTFIPILKVTIISIFPPLMINLIQPEGFVRFIEIGLVCVTSVITTVYLLGITQSERLNVKSNIFQIKIKNDDRYNKK